MPHFSPQTAAFPAAFPNIVGVGLDGWVHGGERWTSFTLAQPPACCGWDCDWGRPLVGMFSLKPGCRCVLGCHGGGALHRVAIILTLCG